MLDGEIAANVWAALWSYFPVGAGVGTFLDVYPLHERVADLIPDVVNRAHNDGLETLFEGGAASLLLLLGFIIWLGAATYRAFVRKKSSKEGRPGRGPLRYGSCLSIHFGTIRCARSHLRPFFAFARRSNILRPRPRISSPAGPIAAEGQPVCIVRENYCSLLRQPVHQLFAPHHGCRRRVPGLMARAVQFSDL